MHVGSGSFLQKFHYLYCSTALEASPELVEFSDEVNALIRIATKTNAPSGRLRRLGGVESEQPRNGLPPCQ